MNERHQTRRFEGENVVDAVNDKCIEEEWKKKVQVRKTKEM